MPEHVEVGTARLLSLVSWIGEHPGVTVAEAAGHFGRTPRQLRRDVETLGDVGDSLPGSSFEVDWDLLAREDRLRVRTTLGLDLPPSLTRAEVSAVLVGLRAIAPVLDEDLRRRLTATAMAVSALGAGSGDVAGGLTVSRPDRHDDRLDLLHHALARKVRVTFDYTSPGGRVSAREVDPWQLRRMRDGWVLRGWCLTADAARTFRVDRISDLHATVEPVVHHEALPDTAPGERVRMRLSAPAQWVLDEVACEVVERGDGAFTVDVPVWSRGWVAALLVDVSPHLLDVEPPSWATAMGRLAGEALEVWDGEEGRTGDGTAPDGTGEAR